MSTPTDGPLVPPSGRAPEPGVAPSHPYATPAWSQPPEWSQAPQWSRQPGTPAPGWGSPESRALHEAETALRKSRTALGWAIAAAVGALVALVAAFAVPALFAFGASTGGAYSYPGQLDSFVPGLGVTGSEVADAVEAALLDDGADVADVNCPDTTSARVSTAIACQGSVDGEDWAYVVYVLDGAGSILITEY